MEMWFIGDLLFDGKSCGVNFKEVPLSFIEDDRYTQLVMTESALSCIANSIAASNHGTIDWNQQRLSQFFVGTDWKLDTSNFGAQFGAIKRKYGVKTQPMRIEIGFKDFDVQIGQFDTDLTTTFVVKIGVFIEGGPELVYDEFKMVISTNVNTTQDIVYPKFINFKILHDINGRNAPLRNSLGMTPAEYREFISVTGFFFNNIKKYMNEVYMANGMHFPYKVEELDTEVIFKDKLMYVMIDVQEEFAKDLEQVFWKSDKDPKIVRD